MSDAVSSPNRQPVSVLLMNTVKPCLLADLAQNSQVCFVTEQGIHCQHLSVHV